MHRDSGRNDNDDDPVFCPGLYIMFPWDWILMHDSGHDDGHDDGAGNGGDCSGAQRWKKRKK